MLFLCMLANHPHRIRAEEPGGTASDESAAMLSRVHSTVERGIEFLQTDTVKWRKERECATCHHGTMTIWALSEAKSHGYHIDDEALTETVKWTKERLLERIDLPRDTRPGWSMVNTSSLYLSMMAMHVPTQDAVSADELKRIGVHLLKHQESDGAWAWSSAPPKNRPPPFFESDEVATLLAYIVLGPRVPNDPKEKSEIRDARARGAAWLKATTPNDTTQATAYRLLRAIHERQPEESLAVIRTEFLARQNQDGGWGQLKDAASDAYATGQALFVLNVAGVPNDRPEVRRAAEFLAATQKEDGAWPMVPRAHPEATPSNNIVPITYFGSAWGTLGLSRMFPK